jgi:hypothetical protein
VKKRVYLFTIHIHNWQSNNSIYYCHANVQGTGIRSYREGGPRVLVSKKCISKNALNKQRLRSHKSSQADDFKTQRDTWDPDGFENRIKMD